MTSTTRLYLGMLVQENHENMTLPYPYPPRDCPPPSYTHQPRHNLIRAWAWRVPKHFSWGMALSNGTHLRGPHLWVQVYTCC